MKLLTFLLTLVSVAQLSVQAQGTFNASNNYIVPGTSHRALVVWWYGEPLSKETGRVQIINAADGSTLSPGGESGVPLVLDGLFSINGLSVPGTTAGGSAHIIVRAWDITSGVTWAASMVRSANSAGLVPLTSLGGGTTPPATFEQNSNFTGLVVGIPEPGTVVLAAFGLAGLVFLAPQRVRIESGSPPLRGFGGSSRR